MKKYLLLFLFISAGTILYAQSRSSDSFRSHRSGSEEVIQIFPNPATTFIGLSAAPDAVEKIIIFNLVGRQMKSFNAEAGEKYYVGDLPKGMYLVQLFDTRNKIITTQRVSKR